MSYKQVLRSSDSSSLSSVTSSDASSQRSKTRESMLVPINCPSCGTRAGTGLSQDAGLILGQMLRAQSQARMMDIAKMINTIMGQDEHDDIDSLTDLMNELQLHIELVEFADQLPE